MIIYRDISFVTLCRCPIDLHLTDTQRQTYRIRACMFKSFPNLISSLLHLICTEKNHEPHDKTMGYSLKQLKLGVGMELKEHINIF